MYDYNDNCNVFLPSAKCTKWENQVPIIDSPTKVIWKWLFTSRVKEKKLYIYLDHCEYNNKAIDMINFIIVL